MDTNNSEYQKALNDLYLAVIRVMKLANPNCLTGDMKRNELIAQLSNWTGLLNDDTNQVLDVVPPPSPMPLPSIPDIMQVGKRYATAPEEDENKYYFKRTVELKTDGDSRFFTINVYGDGSCTYEMKDDVCGEKLQTLVDNKDTMLSSHVVKYSGTPTANSQIITVAVGKAVKCGKSIQIVKPLEIKFE